MTASLDTTYTLDDLANALLAAHRYVPAADEPSDSLVPRET